MDVSQGKLALGFRTGGITCWEEEYPALVMCNAIFGGTPLSKLFLNVREKLSLCYYASSMLEKMKGLVLVSSGIEFDKYQQAKDEILAQLEAIRRGEIEGLGAGGARRALISGHLSTLDDQGQLEEFWLGQAAAGLDTGVGGVGGALRLRHPGACGGRGPKAGTGHRVFSEWTGRTEAMEQIRFERIGEEMFHQILDNGLNVFVFPKPEFQKKYAFFATNYGGMDLRFQLDGTWHDTPAGVAHHLEHKMFDTKEGNALQQLTANGASQRLHQQRHHRLLF